MDLRDQVHEQVQRPIQQGAKLLMGDCARQAKKLPMQGG
jgi:hypothetical protein